MLLILAIIANRRGVTALLLASVLGLLAGPRQAEASIQAGPNSLDQLSTLDPNLSAEHLDKVLERLSDSSRAGSAAGSKSSRQRDADTPEYGGGHELPPVEVRQYANLSPDAGATGGSTTPTSSSSAGAAGGLGHALYATAAPHLSDDAPVERYAAERSLFLPEAPGTELLRPPRG